MPFPPKFVVVDDNPDSRFLLVRTLLRKFPLALVEECQSSDRALALAQDETVTAIVLHRSTEMGGIAMLREVRAINASVPIVMVSSIDRRDASLANGASAFLLYDEWLRIGTVVANLTDELASGRSTPPFGAVDPEADAEPEPAHE